MDGQIRSLQKEKAKTEETVRQKEGQIGELSQKVEDLAGQVRARVEEKMQAENAIKQKDIQIGELVQKCEVGYCCVVA